MGAVAASDLPDIVPSDMDELARHYYDFIRGMVRKNGIPDQDVPDSVQYILERLEKTDVIGQFDPEYATEYQGRQVRTKFSTFLGAKVMLYCRGERGRLARRAGHELQILDRPAVDEDGTGLSALPGLLGAACDDYSGLDAEEFISKMRETLAAIPPRSARDTCDLAALFDELVHEISETGGFTYAGIQDRFGISGTTAGAWLSRLRKIMGQALGRPSVVIGGIALTYVEVAVALKVLREAKGIMVKQPLAKAGHPLGKAAKGWYHRFSAEEIRKFPGIALPPGSRRGAAGNGHVKDAVIHRLERILAESSAQVPVCPDCDDPAPHKRGECPAYDTVLAEPEPEVTPEDEFEAQLWHYIRSADEVDRLKALAQRAYAVSVL